jgi:hypothetical protein
MTIHEQQSDFDNIDGNAPDTEVQPAPRLMSRRSLLRGSVGAFGLALVGCSNNPSDHVVEKTITPSPTEVTVTATVTATASPEATTDPTDDPTPSPTESPEAGTDTAPIHEIDTYPKHTVYAGVFGIGEEPFESYDKIAHTNLSWTSGKDHRTGKPLAVALFGGVDHVEDRKHNGLPKGFTPKHNPFYFGLPASDFDIYHQPVVSAMNYYPFADGAVGTDESALKGHWIQAIGHHKGKDVEVFAQWYDCNPKTPDKTYCDDDEYVFGESDAVPVAVPGVKAAIGLSPSAAHVLGFSEADGTEKITWRFVDEADVPDGPWRDYPPIDNKIRWN